MPPTSAVTGPSRSERAAPRRWRPLGHRVTAGLAAANLAGVGLYLWWAAHAWAIPAERAAGITSLTGEPFVWAIGVLPLWLVFGVVDALWAITVLVPPPRWRDAGVVLAVGAVWAVAVAVDFAHH